MSSTQPTPSEDGCQPEPVDPRVGPAGYHAVIVPHFGAARCERFEKLGELVAALRAVDDDLEAAQCYVFGPDGRRYGTSTEPPYLFTPAGPVSLLATPPPPDAADASGRTRHSAIAAAAPAALSPPPGLPAAGGDDDEDDLSSEFGDDEDDD